MAAWLFPLGWLLDPTIFRHLPANGFRKGGSIQTDFTCSGGCAAAAECQKIIDLLLHPQNQNKSH
jgi:hypothetical protein